MTTLLNVLKALAPFWASPNDRDEAYLAAATDLTDLELRMRELDQRGRDAHSLSLSLQVGGR